MSDETERDKVQAMIASYSSATKAAIAASAEVKMSHPYDRSYHNQKVRYAFHAECKRAGLDPPPHDTRVIGVPV